MSKANQSASRNARNHSTELESALSVPVRAPKKQSPFARPLTVSSAALGLGDAVSKGASGFIDTLLGNQPSAENTTADTATYEALLAQKQAEQRRMQSFFTEQKATSENRYKQLAEEDSKKIEEIKHMIKKEIDRYDRLQSQMNENIERAKKLLLLEQKDIKAGLYHVTMAEVLLMALQNVIVDISRSNNWLEALISRKKRRGSLFATRSKKQGTQYSMSQELSVARSTG